MKADCFLSSLGIDLKISYVRLIVALIYPFGLFILSFIIKQLAFCKIKSHNKKLMR